MTDPFKQPVNFGYQPPVFAHQPPSSHVVTVSEKPTPLPAIQPNAVPVMIMQEDHDPTGFYISLGFAAGGYVMIWLGLVLLATNGGEAVAAGGRWVLLFGLISAIGGSIALCAVPKPQNSGDLCQKAVYASIGFTVLVVIPFIALVSTQFKSSDSSSNDGDDIHWENLSNALAIMFLILGGIAVVLIYGCVTGCFCCLIINKKSEVVAAAAPVPV